MRLIYRMKKSLFLLLAVALFVLGTAAHAAPFTVTYWWNGTSGIQGTTQNSYYTGSHSDAITSAIYEVTMTGSGVLSHKYEYGMGVGTDYFLNVKSGVADTITINRYSKDAALPVGAEPIGPSAPDVLLIAFQIKNSNGTVYDVNSAEINSAITGTGLITLADGTIVKLTATGIAYDSGSIVGVDSYKFSAVTSSAYTYSITSLTFDGALVPEPATLALIGLGVAAGGVLRRRRAARK